MSPTLTMFWRREYFLTRNLRFCWQKNSFQFSFSCPSQPSTSHWKLWCKHYWKNLMICGRRHHFSFGVISPLIFHRTYLHSVLTGCSTKIVHEVNLSKCFRPNRLDYTWNLHLPFYWQWTGRKQWSQKMCTFRCLSGSWHRTFWIGDYWWEDRDNVVLQEFCAHVKIKPKPMLLILNIWAVTTVLTDYVSKMETDTDKKFVVWNKLQGMIGRLMNNSLKQSIRTSISWEIARSCSYPTNSWSSILI